MHLDKLKRREFGGAAAAWCSRRGHSSRADAVDPVMFGAQQQPLALFSAGPTAERQVPPTLLALADEVIE